MAGVQMLLIALLLGIYQWSCVGYGYGSSSESNGDQCFRKGAKVFRRCGVVPEVNYKSAPNETAFGEFPWQVAIIDASSQEFKCSGVLIDEKSVLTSLKCIENVNIENIWVRIGEWDIMNNVNMEESFKSGEIPVKGIIKDDVSEIVRLILKRFVDFELHPHVTPACMPTFEYYVSDLEDCMVAGWNNSKVQVLEFPRKEQDYGEYENKEMEEEEENDNAAPRKLGKIILSQTLQKAAVHLQSEEECYMGMMPYEICVFGLGSSLPCKGDIGAAVICKFDRSPSMSFSQEQSSRYTASGKNKEQKSEVCVPQWELIGIVTQTHSCDDDEIQGRSPPIIAENILGFMGKKVSSLPSFQY